MPDLLEGFLLGNGAILTNACLLPLYPGLIAFLAGNAGNERARRGTAIMGVLVLAGILTMMILIGVILYALQATFDSVLTLLLPAIYLLVIGFGLMMLRGFNPFARLQTVQTPMLSNPYVTAYVYGLFFAPMTLPCTGPILTTAFLLGTADGGNLAGELLYFMAFGVGFGWPLVILPLFALPLQRRVVGWLSRNHDALTRASGMLLIAVGLFGFLTEILPKLDNSVEINEAAQIVYWVLAILVTIGVGWWQYQQSQQKHKNDDLTASAGA